jgi:hypothetical protein
MIRTPWSPASRSRSRSKRWCASAVASAATAAWCKRFQTRPATGPNKKSGSRMQHSVSIVNMNQYGSNRTYCELACTGVMCAGMCIMSAIYSRLLVTLEASAKCNTIANATTYSSHPATRGTEQQGEVQNVGTRKKPAGPGPGPGPDGPPRLPMPGGPMAAAPMPGGGMLAAGIPPNPPPPAPPTDGPPANGGRPVSDRVTTNSN